MAKVTHEKGVISLDLLSERIAELEKLKAFVGWLSSARYEDGTPVAGIAAVQEFGSPRRGIPPRPFLRSAVKDNTNKWTETLARGSRAILKGKAKARDVMEQLGALAVADIKTEIISGDHLPLSPVTIALRKHRNEGQQIGAGFVGAVAAAIARGETGTGELGDQSFGNKRPLNETGYMIATLTHEVTE